MLRGGDVRSISPTTCPYIPIASDTSSPALQHNPRSSSKPVSATPSPTRHVLEHSTVLGANAHRRAFRIVGR